MRSKLFTVSMVAVALFFVGSQVASAGSVSAKQLASFKALEGPFSKADTKWTSALSNLSSKSTVAQVSKPSLAFVPALKTFDAGLAKVGFTGNAATQAADIEKLNGQLVTILSSIKSVGAFQSQVEALFSKYQGVQAALAKDLGVPTADVII